MVMSSFLSPNRTGPDTIPQMDNTAYPSNLTTEGSNVAELKEIDSQKEVGDKRYDRFNLVHELDI